MITQEWSYATPTKSGWYFVELRNGDIMAVHVEVIDGTVYINNYFNPKRMREFLNDSYSFEDFDRIFHTVRWLGPYLENIHDYQ
jgi:hypothetical protein